MKDYLSIGKVSKMKDVSIKSLRYYDEIGIFKPAYVNQSTNYRYYKEDQLYILDAISLCIELGIPLKTLPEYQFPDGTWDFHRLLSDGKTLAEDKIRSMRNSIDTLQSTLRRFDSPADNKPAVKQAVPEPIEKSESTLPKDTYLMATATRHILVTEFDVATSPERYNHKLLALFVGAEKAGLKANYPAGLYYEWDGTTCKRYVYVQIETPDAGASAPEDMEIKKLASGNCLGLKSDAHQIEKAQELFAPVIKTDKPYQLIESSISDPTSKQTYFEMRLFQAHLGV